MKVSLPFRLGIRHVQAVLLFCCLCVNYMMRVNLSIGIVLMTDPNTQSTAKVFQWTVAQQSASQSAFFVGYFFTNITAAVLVTKVNIKYILLLSVTATTALTFATPFLVTTGGYYALIFIRFTLGLMQGFMLSSIYGVFTKWIPPSERSRCSAIVHGGGLVGNLISFSVSGWVGSNHGWPSIFYFSGISGAAWVVLWACIGSESPEKSSIISVDEKEYIEKALGETATLPKNVPIPWRDIIRSKACWAIQIASLAQSWGFWTLVTEIPSYFNAVMHFSPTVNGLLTALPYASLWFLCLLASIFFENLQKTGIISVSMNRKINNTIGHYGAAICLVVLGITTDKTLSIIMYMLGVTFLGCAYIGHNIAHFDILPNFAGFLMGITNGLTNLASISAPLFAGLIIHDASNAAEWRTVFFVSAIIFAIGNTVFLLIGTLEVQDFNKIPEDYNERRDGKTISNYSEVYLPK